MLEKQTGKHHRIVPILLITMGLPIALAIGFLLVANLLYRDEPPPDDSVLQLSDVTVAEAENAYVDLQNMNNDVSNVDPSAEQPYVDKEVDKMLSGEPWNETYASEVISQHASAITDFRLAVSKNQFQGPAGAQPNAIDFNTFFDGLSSVRFVAKLVALDGIQKTQQGDVVAGLAEVMSVVRLAHRMESSQTTLIEWLVSSATKQIGLSALRQIALQTAFTAEQSKSLTQELEKYRDSRSGLTTAMKMEYAYTRTFINKKLDLGQLYDTYFLAVENSGSPPRRSGIGKIVSVLDHIGITKFYFWPNQSWRFAVDQAKLQTGYVQADCATANLNPEPKPQLSQQQGFSRLLEPNTIGKLLNDFGNISNSGILPKVCNESLAVSATQTILAINTYQHDNGKFPTALNELVPKYLDAIPLDVYNGQPLLYLPDQKLVYSVGQDRVDGRADTTMINDYSSSYFNGGDWQNMVDPVFLVTK